MQNGEDHGSSLGICIVLFGYGNGFRTAIGPAVRPGSVPGRGGPHGRRQDLLHCFFFWHSGVADSAGTSDALEDFGHH